MASITAFTATNLLKYRVVSISAPSHVRHKLVSQTASDKSNIAVKQHSFLPRVKQYWLASPYCTISHQNELGQEWAKIMWNFLSSWVWLSLDWVFTWLLQIIDLWSSHKAVLLNRYLLDVFYGNKRLEIPYLSSCLCHSFPLKNISFIYTVWFIWTCKHGIITWVKVIALYNSS